MTPPELLSLVLHLQPENPNPERPLPRWWGRAAHALLLHIVQQADPALASRMHADADQPWRPFTVSNLLGSFPRGKFHPEKPYRLRLTSLDADLTALLLAAAAPGGPLAPEAVVELDFCRFRVLPPPQDGDHWQMQTTFVDLSRPWLSARCTPPRRFTFHFASPTAFKSRGRHMPVPLPDWVFNSLLQRWNTFAPMAMPEETRRFANEVVGVSRYRLQSAVVPLKNGGRRIGAVGEATFIGLNHDRYWLSILATLARFALFSGVGVSTTMGMGQCRWIDSEEAAACPS